MQSYKLRQVHESELSSVGWGLLGSRKYVLQLGLLFVAFVYLYVPIFNALASTWWGRNDSSFSFLVPPISLYLVWLRRERIKKLPIRPAYLAGVSVMVISGAMLLLGEAASVISLQELSLVVMIVGLVLCLFGKEFLKAVGFPIAYLLFTMPIFFLVIDRLHWPFQLLTAKMGVAFLHALGVPGIVERQYLMLPNITLEVAEVCSGVSYLISIIAIGIPLAYVTQKNNWCRVILVVSAVTIGVIGNWIRVAAIGLWAYYGGKVLHGPFEVFQGLFVAQLGFVALFVGTWLLSKVPASKSKNTHFGELDSFSEKTNVENQPRLFNRSWLAAILILIGLASYSLLQQHAPVPLKAEFTLFPISIGSWTGYEIEPNKALLRLPGADHELVKVYRSPSGREIQLYVAYFESQHHPKKLFSYRIARPLHRDAAMVDIPIGQKETITVNQTWLVGDQGKQRIYFWYDFNGRIIADQYKAMSETTLDALMHGRTNGAFVLISDIVTGQEEAENMIAED